MTKITNESVDIQLLQLEIEQEPYIVSKSYESSFYQRVTFKMLDKEKRRRLTNCGVYFAVLLLGVIIGLIPFLIQYVKDTQADREVLRKLVNQNKNVGIYNMTKTLRQLRTMKQATRYLSSADREVLREFVHRNMTDVLKELRKLEAKMKVLSSEKNPSALAITSKTTKTIVRKRASGFGNSDINLECNGDMKIEQLLLDNVAAPPKNTKDFDKYCKTNLVIDKQLKKCKVSVNLALSFKLFTNQLTEVVYTCSEDIKK